MRIEIAVRQSMFESFVISLVSIIHHAPIALCIMFIGCGGRSLLRERAPSPTDIHGEWLLEIRSGDIGHVRTIIDIESDGRSFEGHSREGAAGDILGWWDLMLAKLFTNYFPGGALLHVEQGEIVTASDSSHITAVLVSALGPMRFNGTVAGNSLNGTLTRRGKVVGRIEGRRAIPARPIDRYPDLVERAIEITERNIYNRHVVAGKEWGEFKERIGEEATLAQDDLELIFGFFHFADDLPFSHFHLYRKSDLPDAGDTAGAEPAIALETVAPDVALLKIRSFAGESREIDSLFERIVASDLPNLVIDLRGNSGGNISAMRVAAYLTDTPRYGGVFVTNRWFESHAAPPTVAEFDRFPLLTEANLDLLFNGIHEREGIGLKVIPAERRYGGRVFVLTDRGTASSCEPLVYGIKEYGLGTIVGEPTAGAMLNGEEFPLGDNWYVTIPTAEYYAADGFRIDQVGVLPDVRVKSADALDHVLRTMIAKRGK